MPAIVGVGFTPLVRKSDQSLASLAVTAALNALADAGLERSDIDGYAGTPSAGNPTARHLDGVDEVSAQYMVGALGLSNARWLSDGAHGGLIAHALIAAVQALAAGTCTTVLIVRAMYNPIGVRYAEASATTAGGPGQFLAPYGLNGIGRVALWLQRYLYDHGATKADLYHVAKTLRDHAQLNPYAYWHGKPLGAEAYFHARRIFEPMNLYDCDIPVTGAGAVVLTTAARAAQLRHQPAYIAALATGYEPGNAIFEKSGLTPTDVQCAQLYDGFLPFVWYWLEELGFCGKGQAHAFARDGNIALGGTLPVNTFGGNQGEGRLHGMGHLREGALQVMGRAGERQVPDLEHCLVALGASVAPGCTVLLRRA
jgi:acetyl-CoA acetyltransferase